MICVFQIKLIMSQNNCNPKWTAHSIKFC